MKTGDQRIQKYDAKVTPTTVSLIVAGRLPGMRSAFADPQGMSSLVAKENQIQGRLNGQTTPVPTSFYAFYLNFGRELWKLTRKGIDGTALTQAAQDLKDKYVNYGLESAVLVDLALNVFTQVVT
jgi:hypothetical protein